VGTDEIDEVTRETSTGVAAAAGPDITKDPEEGSEPLKSETETETDEKIGKSNGEDGRQTDDMAEDTVEDAVKDAVKDAAEASTSGGKETGQAPSAKLGDWNV